MINPKSIATIGIGFGPISIATIGFITEQKIPTVVTTYTYISGGKNLPNFLSPVGFNLLFDTIENGIYKCKRVNIPQFGSNNSIFETPMLNIPIIGNKLEYDSVICEIFLDNNFENYLQLNSMVESNHLPYDSLDDFMQSYRILTTNPPQKMDAKLIILTNNNYPNIEVTFIDVFPDTITNLDTSTVINDINPITYTVSFKFSYLLIKTLDK